MGQPRRGRFTWNGDRLFGHYDWAGSAEGVVAFLRFQVLPSENLIWLGHLEVHPEHRQKGIGTQLVWSVEQAAIAQASLAIRLFSRRKSTGFWWRLGYQAEPDPRYFSKRVSTVAGCPPPRPAARRV